MFPLRDTAPRKGIPVVLWTLVALNGLVFWFEESIPGPALHRFIELYALVPSRYTSPEWAVASGLQAHSYWPFLTYMFIHGGWLHIIGNMWFLWIFGDNVEDRLGHLRFLIFYLLCGIGSALFYVLLEPGSMVPTLGASGAISGVMGAYILLYPRARVLTLIPVFFLPLLVEIPAVFFLGVWFLFQFLAGTFSLVTPHVEGGVAWWAHIGGFVLGMVLLPFFARNSRESARPFSGEHLLHPWS
jgi:membrane associated rhomboid family serine protease